MNKDFSREKLLSFNEQKQLKALFDLASFIERKQEPITSSHFAKLSKYHDFLQNSDSDKVAKLNLEFAKVKAIDYQFQVYLMNLERLLGQSKKEYDFITTKDKAASSSRTFPVICLLDSIRSAHNVGAMFRNAECFGVEEVILCGLTATPENEQVQKTSMGCYEKVKWSYHKNAAQIAQQYQQLGYEIWAVETAKTGQDILKIQKIPQKVVLIFGHEQFGVSQELLAISYQLVEIPLFGQKNSLNVSVCQGILLHQVTNFFQNHH
jgi:23S rRNA (guanosine2251-2'-O)-methyltransferase